MSNIKNIFTIFVFLFVFISTNSRGNTYATNTRGNNLYQQTSSQENNTRISSASFSELKGIIEPSIRIVESNIPISENFKNSKKTTLFNFSIISFNGSHPQYKYYFTRGLNNFSSYPFYIAYHRLII